VDVSDAKGFLNSAFRGFRVQPQTEKCLMLIWFSVPGLQSEERCRGNFLLKTDGEMSFSTNALLRSRLVVVLA
jgi:hypothetical protein